MAAVSQISSSPPPLCPLPHAKNALLEKVQKIAGWFLLCLGIALLTGTSCALIGRVFRFFQFPFQALPPYFSAGTVCLLGGFGLASRPRGALSTEITVGPLAVTF